MPDSPVTAHGAVAGTVACGFGAVLDEFARIMAGDHEAGAALAVYIDDEPVVDLWGGRAGPYSWWERDTACVALSATKGLATLCMQLLVAA